MYFFMKSEGLNNYNRRSQCITLTKNKIQLNLDVYNCKITYTMDLKLQIK